VMATIKVKGATDGKKQTVNVGVNDAGKGTEKRFAETRSCTPKENKPSLAREKRPR